MNNLYNYVLTAHNGDKKEFIAQPNKETKEFNLMHLKNLFKTAKLNGEIYSQDNPKEKYIFINGEEQQPKEKYITIFDLQNKYKELNKLINKALELGLNINLNKDAYKSLKELEKINALIKNESNEFLTDLNNFTAQKNELNIKPNYNFLKKGE